MSMHETSSQNTCKYLGKTLVLKRFYIHKLEWDLELYGSLQFMCPYFVSKDQWGHHICICLLSTLDQHLGKQGNFILVTLVYLFIPCVFSNIMRELQLFPNNICASLTCSWDLCTYSGKQLCAEMIIIITIPATG